MKMKVCIFIDKAEKVKSNDDYHILSIHCVLSYMLSNLILTMNSLILYEIEKG